MMKIEEILNGIEVVSVTGMKDRTISAIEFDSRKVIKDSLFVAVKGYKSDGHDFINSAIASGATAIICEVLPESALKNICWIKTTDSAKALGLAASNFFGNPSSALKLVGVTGTNGKTTIATLLYRMFRMLGYKCGLFSTVCNYINEKEFDATHTTPDPVQLNYLLSEMVRDGCLCRWGCSWPLRPKSGRYILIHIPALMLCLAVGLAWLIADLRRRGGLLRAIAIPLGVAVPLAWGLFFALPFQGQLGSDPGSVRLPLNDRLEYMVGDLSGFALDSAAHYLLAAARSEPPTCSM